jgi:hypothetical protein
MNCFSAKDVVELILTLAWPVVACIALIYFREPQRRLLAERPRRASKITGFNFSIELAKVPQMTTNWSAGGVDVRRMTPASMFDSNTSDLIEQISGTGVADYAVIDLGEGREWLTSRLFLIAELLDRMRSLDCIVFVQTRATSRAVFIGLAHPRAVRWCLARVYPWLEPALVQAYATQFGLPAATPNLREITSTRGAIPINKAAEMLKAFLNQIQKPTPAAIPPAVLPDQESGWIDLESSPPVREYAEWLNAQRINTLLADVISTSSFEDSPDLPNSERVESILRRTGAFVALVDRHGFFEALVNRQILLETAAASAVQPKPRDDN